MIARLMGEGQYSVDDELREQLNELDDRAVQALEADDEPALDGVLDEMWELVRGRGERLPDDDLSASDIVIPPSDLTLEETKKLFSENGLVPDLPLRDRRRRPRPLGRRRAAARRRGPLRLRGSARGRAAGCVEVTVNRAEISPALVDAGTSRTRRSSSCSAARGSPGRTARSTRSARATASCTGSERRTRFAEGTTDSMCSRSGAPRRRARHIAASGRHLARVELGRVRPGRPSVGSGGGGRRARGR